MDYTWLIVTGELALFFLGVWYYLRVTRVKDFAVCVQHESIEGMPLDKVRRLIGRNFVVTHLRTATTDSFDGAPADSAVLHHGDHLLIQARTRDIEPIIAFLGQPDIVEQK